MIKVRFKEDGELPEDFFELTLSGISYVARTNEINIYIGR